MGAAEVPAERVCASGYSALDKTTFERAAQVGDEMTSELLLDLDASLGAASEWCRRGDTKAAAREHADAAKTALALERRLAELGVR